MAATNLEFTWDEFPAPSPLPRGTLLQEATPFPASDSVVGGVDRFRAGVKFTPWGCSHLGGTTDSDCNPVLTLGESDYRAVSEEGTVTQPAFSVWDALKCTMLSWPDEEIVRRLTGQFDLRLSESVAHELITADGSGGHGFADDATVLSAVGLDAVEAMSLLEDALSGALGRGEGIVHAPPRALAYLSAADAVRPDGNWYRTPRGHRLVVDDGYTLDSTPTGESTENEVEWLYASGPVYYIVDTVRIRGAMNQESMLLARNIRKVLAETYGLLVYDPCAVFAAKLEVVGGVIEGS